MTDPAEQLVVFDGRAVRIKDQYDRRLARASERVDVLGFGLRSLREDYGAAKLENLAARAPVRVLLLDPDFPNGHAYKISSLRDQEERNSEGQIERDIREFVVQVLPLTRKLGKNLQIRLYAALPMLNMFRIDDDLFFGPYLIDEQSRNSPTFLVQRGWTLFDHLTEHFERLWSDEWSRPAESLDDFN